MSDERPSPQRSRRMPENTLLYERVVPILLAVLGIVMLALIVLAAGVLLNVITWR